MLMNYSWNAWMQGCTPTLTHLIIHLLTQHATEPIRGGITLDLVISKEEHMLGEARVGKEFDTNIV